MPPVRECVAYLQDSRQQVSKMLQQCRVAFIGQNEGCCSASCQGTNLTEHFKEIKCTGI